MALSVQSPATTRAPGLCRRRGNATWPRPPSVSSVPPDRRWREAGWSPPPTFPGPPPDLRWREPAGFLEQRGPSVGRAAGTRPRGSLVECCRHIAIGSCRRQGKVPGTFFNVDHRLSQPAVDRLALTGRRRLVTDRGKQRMREADTVALDLEQAQAGRAFDVRVDRRRIVSHGADLPEGWL